MKKVKRLVGSTGTYTVDGQEKTRWFPMGTLLRRMTATSSSSWTVFPWALIFLVGFSFSTLTTTPNRQQRQSLHPAAHRIAISRSKQAGPSGPNLYWREL